ncbi:MAG: GNAT family N-acetyltransferase [Chthonomonas sp.]|nr:GNAT family N-acetyltransferase [Chthonomonas sp.]
MEWTQPLELRGQRVRIRPLQLQDAFLVQPHLEPDTFKYFVTIQPATFDLEGSRDFVEQLLRARRTQAFVIEDRGTGEFVGMSTFMDMREEHRALEIGMTWYRPDFRGTSVNPEVKLLMLEQAFERWLCLRVQLKTDGRNYHSQRAIMKLGAKLEGTLRNHAIQPNGFVRDTVMFSLTDAEWPEAKAGLIERLKLPEAKVN